MRFKIDENLPESAKTLLNSLGHDCHSVYDESIQGGSDDELIEVCRREQRHLLTLDLDFADIVSYPPTEYEGIIVLRLARQDAPYVVSRIEQVLEDLSQLELNAHLVIVDDHRIRYR